MTISLRTFARDLTLTHDSSRLWRYRQRVCIPFGKTPPSKNKMAARSVTKKSFGAECSYTLLLLLHPHMKTQLEGYMT